MKQTIIHIGYSIDRKIAAINSYLKCNQNVCHVIVFHQDGWETMPLDAEFIPFSETIMYRTFYPLLQRIDDSYLLVWDECMRVTKRQDLHYNCIHHYCNQTTHKLAFEMFPFIDEYDDYMILLDFVDKGRYRHRRFCVDLLAEVPVSVQQRDYSLTRDNAILPPGAQEQYQREKTKLFANLGRKDPDTIPNALQIFAGKFKRINPEKRYLARSRRYKNSNVATFTDGIEAVDGAGWTFLDLPLRQKVFNDLLTCSGLQHIEFLHSGLKVDDYFFNRYVDWFEKVRKFNAEAGLHA